MFIRRELAEERYRMFISVYILCFRFSGKKRRSSLWLHQPKRRKIVQTVENNVALTPVLESKNTVKPLSADLKKAPVKILAGKEKGRKELFEKSALEKSEYQILHLMPKVLNKLQESGHIVEFCNFIRLVSEDKFPLRNISWLLFLDVVRWYSLQTTTQITYSEESMKFWKVLYRLFHGKALRFMSGLKFTLPSLFKL